MGVNRKQKTETETNTYRSSFTEQVTGSVEVISKINKNLDNETIISDTAKKEIPFYIRNFIIWVKNNSQFLFCVYLK